MENSVREAHSLAVILVKFAPGHTKKQYSAAEICKEMNTRSIRGRLCHMDFLNQPVLSGFGILCYFCFFFFPFKKRGGTMFARALYN